MSEEHSSSFYMLFHGEKVYKKIELKDAPKKRAKTKKHEPVCWLMFLVTFTAKSINGFAYNVVAQNEFEVLQHH